MLTLRVRNVHALYLRQGMVQQCRCCPDRAGTSCPQARSPPGLCCSRRPGHWSSPRDWCWKGCPVGRLESPCTAMRSMPPDEQTIRIRYSVCTSTLVHVESLLNENTGSAVQNESHRYSDLFTCIYPSYQDFVFKKFRQIVAYKNFRLMMDYN